MQAIDYYDSIAGNYFEMYEASKVMDLSLPYPANYIRLQMLKKSFLNRNNIIDCGCGDGSPMNALRAMGKKVCGFDISPKMVEQAGRGGFDFIVADITKPDTYAPLMEFGPFDGLVCTGVMPHIEDEKQVIENIRDIVEKDGKVFIEFRNKLFSLFTANRLTAEFISEELTEKGFDSKEYLSGLVDMSLPPERPYDQMMAKFHNPIEISEYFEHNGFKDVNILWYHQHPTLPALEKENPKKFREIALQMEGRVSWKNLFTCSAFVIEAVKI
jgi:2-polyprenyl-3-methyl-5-hydroxy-6-metoxy-1,4-benzoquinol methylase